MGHQATFHLITGITIGVILGFIIFNFFSPKARRYHAIKKELDLTKQALQSQKQIVVKHFAYSAELLDNLAKDFRHLYQHVAENSNTILSKFDLDSPTFTSTDEAKKTFLKHSSEELQKQPKDYTINNDDEFKN
ncbi:ZapG family protein [Candidatus Schmidhempelia bombi]|uniref:Z-ring associated protein G n=1 Tax=Candidatus Schmidhempelia bombi str. Bimp TaxID=1387197 RepID=A0AB94IBH5_9GAMM|nr:DUF1043 family protein [Candidatus Schmidhempelia bombi]TEA26757.1 DUF1043 family protein [Candidatus Schmidhempelia bombi str. Bimp]